MGGPESQRLEPRTMLSLTVTNFPIPLVEIVKPDGITTGSDGNLWFTENASGQIGRITPAGVVTQFALPEVPPPAGSPAGTASTTPNPTAITAGPDGALWFTGIPGEIGRITTAGVVTEFPLPAVPPPAGSKPGTASTPATATAIAAGPDGALWFAGIPGEIGRISTTGVVTEFAVPEIPPPAGSKSGTAATPATLTALTAGPDGALWFTGVPGEVGKITTAGVVTEFAVPAIPPPAGSSPGTARTPATLDDITAGPDGALWFTGVPGEVGRITTAGVVTEYATPNLNPPSNGLVTTITTGPDGNLWLTGQTAIGRITPTGIFTSFNAPGNFNTIAGLTAGPGGNLWFTEQEDGTTRGEQPAIGEITPAGVTKLYALPQGTTLDPNLGVPADPTVITTATDGALWFGENGAIGRITTAGVIQQFPLPTPTATVENGASGPDGAVWFAQQNPDFSYSIGRITTNGTITIYALSPNSTSAYVTAGSDGDAWFTETLSNPQTDANTVAIGKITPQGQIKTFFIPLRESHQYTSLGVVNQIGAITAGPDGSVWFEGDYADRYQQYQSFIGRITARGQVRLFELPPSVSSSSSNYPYRWSYADHVSSLVSGPGGKLWFTATNAQGTSGIAQISTGGKLGRFIPADVFGNLAAGPNGQVWFPGNDQTTTQANQLAFATRSGIVVTQDLPAQDFAYGGIAGLTVSSSGSLWLTSGRSSIVRVSGLDLPAGGLDYQRRPKRAPDYDTFENSKAHDWTNVTKSAHPTFWGVANPGAEVTLWVQKQGESQPVSIGQVKASKSDGSWTLKSDLKLSDGNYAVTATQTGDTGPPSVLYSLTPDASGNLSNALVIQTPHAGKAKAERASHQIANI